jgi:hypothetical protein
MLDMRRHRSRQRVSARHHDTATIEDVPEGFKVVATEHGPNFYCTICEVPAEP